MYALVGTAFVVLLIVGAIALLKDMFAAQPPHPLGENSGQDEILVTRGRDNPPTE